MKTLTIVVCLTLALLPSTGRAQMPPDAAAQAKTLNAQGLDAYKAKDYAKAVADFRQAMTLNPADEAYVYNLGLAYQKTKQFSEAAQLLDAQMPKFPSTDDQKELRILLADIHFYWARTLDDKNNFQGAIDHYQLAYDIDKTLRHPDAGYDLNNIGDDYRSLKQYPQAITFYQKALDVKRGQDDAKSAARTLNSLGLAYYAVENYAQAIPCYQQALASVPDNEAYVYNLGLAYEKAKQFSEGQQLLEDKLKLFPKPDDQNELQILLADTYFFWAKEMELSYDYQGAISHYQLAYDIDKTLRHKDAAIDMNNLGSDYDGLSQYALALKYYLLALPLKREVADKRGEADTLSNIGLTYNHLADFAKAIDYTQQAYAIDKTLRRKDAGIDLSNLGSIYSNAGQHETAIVYLTQALDIRREVKDRRGEGTTLNGLGVAYEDLHQYAKSFDYYKQALAIRREVKDTNGDAVTLSNLGAVSYDLGHYPDAARYNQQALILRREMHDRAGEATTLNNLMLDLKYDGKPALAIFFGKMAVNTYQSIRADLHRLPEDQQQSFLAASADTYRNLAELLSSQKRQPEAQQVLGLLTAGTSSAASLTPQETEWGKSYNEIADRVTALGQERVALLAKPSLTPTEQTRLDSLERDLDAAERRFQDLLTRLVQQSDSAPPAKSNRA